MTGPLRATLRRLARTPAVTRRLAAQPAVARSARRYVPGPGVDDAVAAGIDLAVLGIGASYRPLLPVPADRTAAQANARLLVDLLERLRAQELAGELTVPPSVLGAGPTVPPGGDVRSRETTDPSDTSDPADPGDDADELLADLAARCAELGSFLWLDSEPGMSVDRAIARYERLHARHPRTGIALRASLRRTAADAQRLLSIDPAIRLVKGDHEQTGAGGFRSRREGDANYLALAVTLLREGRARTVRLGVGTHDLDLVAQVAEHAAAAGIGRDAFEIHALYGVRPRDQRRLVRAGYRVQVLVPFGPDWVPWFAKRVEDRPSTLLGVLRPGGPGA